MSTLLSTEICNSIGIVTRTIFYTHVGHVNIAAVYISLRYAIHFQILANWYKRYVFPELFSVNIIEQSRLRSHGVQAKLQKN